MHGEVFAFNRKERRKPRCINSKFKDLHEERQTIVGLLYGRATWKGHLAGFFFCAMILNGYIRTD